MTRSTRAAALGVSRLLATRDVIAILLLTLMGIAFWSLNSAPALFAPIVPELWVVGTGLLLLGSAKAISRKGRGPESLIFWGTRILGLLATLTLVRGLWSYWAAESLLPLCTSTPGFVQELECALQAATDQNYAVRTALYMLAASFLFLGSMSFTATQGVSVIPGAIVSITLAFTLITRAMSLGWISPQWVPAPLLLSNATARQAFLMANSSWIGPYLVPGIAATLALLVTRQPRWLKALALIAVMTFADLLLRTQQRGSLLIVIAVGTGLCLLALNSFVTRRTTKSWLRGLVLALASLGSLAAWVVLMPRFMGLLATMGYGERFSQVTTVSQERLLIWRGALTAMDSASAWLWGHGYGTWYRLAVPRAKALGFDETLDTAHNFFVQLIFELGLIHLALLALAITLIAVGALRSAQPRRPIARIWAVAAVAYAPVLMVQEVDFVRPIYYLNAMFWGWLVGLGIRGLGSRKPSRWLRLRRASLVSAGIGLIVAGIACLGIISLAGYQYEANVFTGYQPRVRWLRPKGTITHITLDAAEKNLYAVYEIRDRPATRVSIRFGSTGLTYNRPLQEAAERAFFPVKVRGVMDRPDWLDFEGSVSDASRVLALQLIWPPVLTSLPLEHIDGAYQWETFAHLESKGKVMWCGGVCRLRLAPCPQGGGRLLNLGAMRPDINAENSLLVATAAGGVTEFSEFTAANATALVPVPTAQEILVIASRTYTSDADSRRFGVALLEAQCQAPPAIAGR